MVVLKIIEEWMRHLNMKIVKRKKLSFKNRLYSKLKEHLRYRPCKRFQVQFFSILWHHRTYKRKLSILRQIDSSINMKYFVILYYEIDIVIFEKNILTYIYI